MAFMRYGVVAAGAGGAAAGAAGAAGAVGATGAVDPDGDVPLGPRKKRKNSEVGDNTIVVPEPCSALA